MFLDDPKTRIQITKWAVGTVAACILIFLGIRYVSAIAIAVRWLRDLVKPLLTGTILAMVLNVPLAFIEKHLFRKNPTPKKEKARRPPAILRIPYAPMVGALVGVTALIPYVGAVLATIVGAFMILTVNPFFFFVFIFSFIFFLRL